MDAILDAADAGGLAVAVSIAEGERTDNVWINDAACRIHGRTREQLLEQHALAFIAPDEMPKLREHRARRLRGEHVDPRLETVIVRPDGTRVPIAVTVTYIGDGPKKTIVSLFEDISARTAATTALAASEARFRELVERAPEAVAVLRDDRLVYANPSLVRLMGYDDDTRGKAMIGRSIADFLADEGDGAREPATRISSGPTFTPVEYRFRKRDGGTVIAEITTFLGQWEGAPAFIAMGRDVTERIALESQLARADRLAALGTLSAGVAHEINNPLTFLTLGIDALEPILDDPSVGEPSRARARAIFDEIRRGAQRVAAIVRDLRAFARFEEEAGGPVDLGAVLASAQRIVAHELRAHGRFAVEIAEVLPPVVGSARKLEQVFVNLLINAAQALPQKGGTMALLARVEGRAVVVEVHDDGPGIPEEHLGRVFDPFFTTKPPGVGTGLGLSICHGIVTRLGGEITIDSAPGEGTIVRVSLPTSGAPVPASKDHREVRSPRRRARVLVVDDEPALALTLRCVLERDHDVVTAGEGRAALSLLENGDFDLVLCDLTMPGISGDAVYERVAAARPDLAARFVFMTGGAFTARLQSFLDRVPNPRLQKPFPVSALEDLIGSVTGVDSRR